MDFRSVIISNGSPQQIAITVLTIIIGLLYYVKTKKNNLPPGPLGIPLFGYLPFLGKRPELQLTKLKQKYGNIFSMYMGNRLTVVLGDYDAIQQAFLKSDDFNDRPDIANSKISSGDSGVSTTNGTFWQLHRRAIIRAFRDKGIETSSFERQVQEEILHFLETLDSLDGNGKKLKDFLHLSLCNVILMITCDTKFDYGDENFKEAAHYMQDFMKHLSTTTMRHLLPWTKYLPILKTDESQNALLRLKMFVKKFYEPIIKQHEANNTGDSRVDYMDSYITERKNHSPDNEDLFKVNTLLDNLTELLAAGTDTTEITLRWLLLQLMIQPNIQKKVHAEIDEIIGMNRLPSLADRLRMPYTNAAIQEALRYSSIVPLGLLHCNREKTTLLGYDIPEKTIIMPNFFGSHFDKKLWKDPENFRPERFINKDGQFEKSPYILAFSLGKRVCFGENLARNEIFLYFTSMFQKYNVKLPDNQEMPSDFVEPHGVINSCIPFNVRLKRRENYFAF